MKICIAFRTCYLPILFSLFQHQSHVVAFLCYSFHLFECQLMHHTFDSSFVKVALLTLPIQLGICNHPMSTPFCLQMIDWVKACGCWNAFRIVFGCVRVCMCDVCVCARVCVFEGIHTLWKVLSSHVISTCSYLMSQHVICIWNYVIEFC